MPARVLYYNPARKGHGAVLAWEPVTSPPDAYPG